MGDQKTSGTEKPTILHCFVDEAGDPKLFGRRGKVVVGNPGVSRYFLLGRLEVENPKALAGALAELRAELLADPYFKGVPSMQPARKKTARAFHANDDLDAVRREVYRVLLKPEHDLKFSAVVRDKLQLAAFVGQQNERDREYRYRENEVYDSLVTELFQTFHMVVDLVDICYAVRGRTPRTNAFEAAIEKAEGNFVESFGMKRANAWRVRPNLPPNEPGLQAADYFLWAVQRFLELGEARFVELIWPKVLWVHDLDIMEGGKRGVRYDRNRPLFDRPQGRKK